MKSTPLSLLFLSALLMVSCDQRKDANDRAISGFDQAESSNGQGLSVEAFQLVPLEASEASMITSIQRVECVDTLMVVQTSDALLVFGQSGSFITQLGRKGHGPGEYVTLWTFAVDRQRQRVCLVDEASKRFLFYGLDGTYLFDKTMDAATMPSWVHRAVFDGDDLVFTHYMYNSKNTFLSRFNPATATNTVLHTLPVKTANTGERAGTAMMSTYGDSLTVLLPFDNRVYTLRGDVLSPRWIIETEKALPDSKELSNIEDFSIMTYAALANEGRFTGFTALFETKNHVVFNVLFSSSYFLVDKIHKTGRLFSYEVEEGQTCLPLLPIIGTKGEAFIGLLEPMKALSLKSLFPTETKDPHIRALTEHVASMTFDANPTLLFYTLK